MTDDGCDWLSDGVQVAGDSSEPSHHDSRTASSDLPFSSAPENILLDRPDTQSAAPTLCFPSLPTLLSNQAEKPLKAGFLKLMSSFHFPHMAEQICAAELPPSTVLESATRSLKSTELTPINQSACNGVPVIYASGWAPLSAPTIVHGGW